MDASDIEGDNDEEREEFCMEYLLYHTTVIQVGKFDLETLQYREQASIIVGEF